MKYVKILSIILLFAAATQVWAEEAAKPPCMAGMTKPCDPKNCPAMKGDKLPDCCKQMMEKQEAMKKDMGEMDAKLDGLVAAMNQADDAHKIAAITAVITEAVAQRKKMGEAMMNMEPEMMRHMMAHCCADKADGKMHSGHEGKGAEKKPADGKAPAPKEPDNKPAAPKGDTPK